MRKMKGIALAIETIIFIILAVTVLSVLLLFFTGVAGPSQNEVQLIEKSNRLCGRYFLHEPTCRDITNKEVTGFTGELRQTCSSLEKLRKVASPKCDTISPECVQSCCALCPK